MRTTRARRPQRCERRSRRPGLAQSRKRRKARQRSATSMPQRLKGSDPLSASDSSGLTQEGDRHARNGRPTAVTVGAVVAARLAAANLIAVIAGWDGAAGSDDRARALAGSLLVTGLLCAVAYGMWHAKYWAVLGMQTLLALTVIAASLGIVTAENAGAMLVLLAIIAGAGTLFWFMVKAMARIQMPERPSRAR